MFGGFELRSGVSGQTLQEVNSPAIVSVLVMVQGHTVNSFAPDAHKAQKLTLPASLILGLLNQWVRVMTEDLVL